MSLCKLLQCSPVSQGSVYSFTDLLMLVLVLSPGFFSRKSDIAINIYCFGSLVVF